ncbi:hypothetical protein KC322_g36 [Hortaea werneckii]|nr:hypothetical protein KC322_g36 [Hortaea werneckii]
MCSRRPQEGRGKTLHCESPLPLPESRSDFGRGITSQAGGFGFILRRQVWNIASAVATRGGRRLVPIVGAGSIDRKIVIEGHLLLFGIRILLHIMQSYTAEIVFCLKALIWPNSFLEGTLSGNVRLAAEIECTRSPYIHLGRKRHRERPAEHQFGCCCKLRSLPHHVRGIVQVDMVVSYDTMGLDRHHM